VRRLEDAVDSVDLTRPPDAVGIFVAPGETHVLPLPFSVHECVAIDETFATRDLVRGLERTPRYRLLALGEKPVRLLEGAASTLVEVQDAAFPVFVEGARGEPLASGGPVTRTSPPESQRLAFFRRVDEALDAVSAGDPLPLVVAGTERDLAYYDEVTRHADAIVGRLPGNHEDTRPDVLAQLASPLIERHLGSRRAELIHELVEAVGPGRAVVGVDAAWDATLAGRARILLIEGDFTYPARVVDDRLEPADAACVPGVVDAVDELVERVLDQRGEVVVCNAGELADHGPVAMLLRY